MADAAPGRICEDGYACLAPDCPCEDRPAAARGLYYAAVKYPVDAPTPEKIKALRDGLEFVAIELIDLGADLDDVREWCENAALAAEWEAEANATR